MILDNEQVLSHPTIGFKSDARPYSFLADTKTFDNKEKPLDPTGLNAEGIVKVNQNGVVRDIKGNYGNEKEVRDIVTSNSHSSKNMDSFQDSVFYLDKSVMECEVPELVVCYKDDTYHVVKDICIDEGVPAHNKSVFESGLDEKSDSKSLSSEKDNDIKPMTENLEIDVSKPDVSVFLEENQLGDETDCECDANKKCDANTCMRDVSLSLEENESNKGAIDQYNSKDLMLTREMKGEAMEKITGDVSKELFTLGELLSIPELSTVKTEAMSSDCKGDNGIKQHSFQKRKNEVMVMPPSVSAVEESNSSGEDAIQSDSDLVSAAEESVREKGEATLTSPAQASSSEESTSSVVNGVSSDSKLETGSITFDIDSSAPKNNKTECHHDIDREPHETGSAPKLEDTADQPLSNNLQCSNGESSFSALGPLTGLISYSGTIAYSGNLSIRSDSSTTSTRSFAFPILQSEWNSSPVRMAKADRRHYRKHTGWRQGLLCCRF